MQKKILEKAIKLREKGNYEKAITLLLNLRDQFPAQAEIPAILCHCFLLQNKIEVAEKFLDIAKSIDPNEVTVGVNEARLLLKKKRNIPTSQLCLH